MQMIDDDIALALKIAAKDAGIKLEIGASDERSKNGRASRAEIQKMNAAVLNVLPGRSGKYLAVSKIASKVSIDYMAVRTALGRLRKDAKIANNGRRGLNAGWRRTV